MTYKEQDINGRIDNIERKIENMERRTKAGTGTCPAEGNVEILFSTPFTTDNIVVVSTPNAGESGGGQSDFWGVTNITKNGFTQHSTYDNPMDFLYIAMEKN